MSVAMRKIDARQWFGVAPPDLSVIARSRGADWLYTYLRTFYRDSTRATGWNNLAFPGVGMSHALWQLQGMQRLEVIAEEHDGRKIEHRRLVLDIPGEMTPAEYDALVRDLVNYLVYMGEPAGDARVRFGIYTMLFVVLLIAVTYGLKRAYWKDVH